MGAPVFRHERTSPRSRLIRKQVLAHRDSKRLIDDGREPSDDRAHIEPNGPFVWLTLTRPDKANALDLQMIERLLVLLNEAETREETRVLIITGAGRNFCAGADLDELLSGGADKLRKMLERLRNFTTLLEQSRLITIAAVHGAVRAGGLELALACDVVMAEKSASFGDAHIARNLLPGGGSSVRLPRCIGWNRAKWMILSAASISADIARDWGLVLDVTEDGMLRERAQQTALSLMQGDPVTIKRAKMLMMMIGEQSFSAALEAEITTLQAHYHSDALKDGVGKFLDRKQRNIERGTT